MLATKATTNWKGNGWKDLKRATQLKHALLAISVPAYPYWYSGPMTIRMEPIRKYLRATLSKDCVTLWKYGTSHCFKMGRNLRFSKFEIWANVWVLTTKFKSIAVCFYPTLITRFLYYKTNKSIFSFAPSREFWLYDAWLRRHFCHFSTSGAVWSFSSFSRNSKKLQN